MSNPQPQADLFLARRAAAGHPDAWEHIVDAIGDGLWSIAWQFGGSHSAAEDLVQEMFLRLWRQLPAYRGNVPLKPWAFALSRNLCIDLWRRRAGERTTSQVGEEALAFAVSASNPAHDAERSEESRRIHEALADLPEALAEVVILCDLEEWTMIEAAAAIDVPLGTVKSRLHRGRALLTALLTERLEHPAPLQSTRENPR